jgi:Flp pilus assembly protein TadG
MGHFVDQHDQLDARGLVMSIMRPASFTACENGNTAVEFALILPAFATLVVGTLYAGVLLYSAAGLHNAVETAARCFSVNAGQCSSVATTQSYAQSQYHGVSSPTFTASTTACGYQVSATVTVALAATLANWNVPLSATACFP